MNIIRACRHCTGFAVIWSFTLLTVISLLVAGVLIRLYYKPFNLEDYMPTVHRILHLENVGGIKFDNLALSFDGRFNFQGDGVLVVGPDNEYVATGRHVRLELSMLSLLKGQLAFKLLEFDGLGVRVVADGDNWQIGQYSLPENTQKNDKIFGDFLQTVGQILRQNKILKYLEVVNFRDGMAHITVKDGEASYQWEIADTDLLLTHHNKQGLDGEMTGLLKRGDDATSFLGTIEQPKSAPNLRIKARLGEIQSRLFSPLLPQNMGDKINAFIESLNVSARFDKTLALSRASLDARLGKTHIKKLDMYPSGINLRSANLGFSYFPPKTNTAEKPIPEGVKPHGYLQIDDFVVEDAQGLIVSGQGEFQLPTQSDAIIADTLFQSKSAQLHEAMTYLPPKHTRELINWFKKSTNYQKALLEDITLSLSGDVQKFSFGDSSNKKDTDLLQAHFNFKNLDLDLHQKLPRLRKAKGQAVLEGGQMRIASPGGGMMKDQNFSDIDVLISNIFDKNGKALIRGTGNVAGSAQGLLPMIAQLFDSKPILDDIEGQQESSVDIVFPLGGEEDDLQFSVNTKVTNTAFTLPHIDKPFNADEMTAQTTDQKLTVKSTGEVAFMDDVSKRWPVKLMWQENMKNLGAETYVEAALTTLDNPAPDLLGALKTDIKGEMTHNLTLRRNQENPAWFDVTINSDLTPADISIKSFDWEKTFKDEGRFKLEGQINKNGQVFDAEMLLLDAPDAEIMGAAYLKLDDAMDITDYTLRLSPFKLGKTHANVVVQDDTFRLTGEKFNFTGIGKGRLHEDMTLADGTYEVDLGKLVFKGGEFFNIKGAVVRDENKWESAQINAKVGKEKKDFTLLLSDVISNSDEKITPSQEKEKRPSKHLEVYSGDAGASLRSLGIYENLYQGEMEALLKIYKEHSPFGFDAKGHVLIENAFVRNAPAMVRLLSLISLEQIMSAGQGIAFEEMKLPLEMQNRTLYIHDGKMKGPNIAMKLSGNIDFAQSKIDMDGALTPASGINSVLGNIPLLGALLTGTQGAMMVADFGVEGDTSEPDVWANPLSLVTPGLLKDIFGGIFGSQARSEAPNEHDVLQPKEPKNKTSNKQK